MSEFLVSIIIIAFNQEKFIQKAITSCLEQITNFPFEIIIHDDASQDNTPSIIKEFARKYPNKIRLILQNENQYSKGKIISSKFCLPQAKGKYLAFCEGDDYWTDPYKLQKQIDIFIQNPSISLCYTATKWVFNDAIKNEKINRHYNSSRFVSNREVIMKGGGVTDTVSTMVRKDIYDDMAEWYDLSPVGDVALYLLSIIRGRVYYLKEVTCVYNRGVSNSWTQNNKLNIDHQINYLKRLIKMKDEYDKYTNYEFHSYLKKRNNLDIIDLSFILQNKNEFFEIYFPRLTFAEKLEYHVFHLLKSRLLWHRFHKFLQLFGIY